MQEDIISSYCSFPFSLSGSSSSASGLNSWSDLEWLEVDGLGGWSSQAIGSVSTRRYHSLLMVNEPWGRMNYVSQLEEFVEQEGKRVPISSNFFPGTIYPEGYKSLVRFGIGPGFISQFQVGEGVLTREIIKKKNSPSTYVRYSWSGKKKIRLEVAPLFSYRGFHDLQSSYADVQCSTKKNQDGIELRPFNTLPSCYVYAPGADICEHFEWYYRFQYKVEKQRGLNFEEDLFTLLRFNFEINPGTSKVMLLSRSESHADVFTECENVFKDRVKDLDKLKYKKGASLWHLSRSARQCIIQTPRGNPGIVAGYHWFEEWGRDTFLTLPYFLNEFHSKEEVYQIFFDFLSARKDGLVPNRFFGQKQEVDGKPDDKNGISSSVAEYNSVDALLWLVIAAFKVFEEYKEISFIREIFPLLRECLSAYEKGTHFGIGLGDDGLLYAGSENTQLTWMDARVNGVPVTPREGAAVEICAAWYNALRIQAVFAKSLGLDEYVIEYELKAEASKEAFRKHFMLQKEGYLADAVSGGSKDVSFRPNQIFALSLPFPLLTTREGRLLLFQIRDRLLTPKGLRTLCRNSPLYQGVYNGGPEHRDGAYHQGTVWPWLFAPYWEAVKKYAESDLRPELEKIIDDFQSHLYEGCLGSISEVFDGEDPHMPGGTISQAWSIGAVQYCLKSFDR